MEEPVVNHPGRVLWLIGLSGAGKTAIGELIYEEWKARADNVVFLDGDLFREVMGEDLGHTVEDRRKNGWRICRMCKYLSEQGIHVVCGILSIFPDQQEWNRKEIKDYREVYVKASLETLAKRNNKGLYGPAMRGERDNVVGVDIEFPEPNNPDLILDNEEQCDDLDPLVRRVINELDLFGDPSG